ncbi:hypothetical protein ACFLQ0_05530, partial [Nitrospinota bacterium]
KWISAPPEMGLPSHPAVSQTEIAGLSEEQMAFSREEPVWARWSADMQLRHIALMICRWLGRLREPLERKGYTLPEVDLAEVMSGNGRHIPPSVCPDSGSLLAFIGAHCELCTAILEREDPEFLRAITCERVVDPEAHYADSPGRPIDFARMASERHPYGWKEVPDQPGHFAVEMVAALRQIHWEILAHLRTIQRLKGLLGLPVKVALPREGYLADPEYYD